MRPPSSFANVTCVTCVGNVGRVDNVDSEAVANLRRGAMAATRLRPKARRRRRRVVAFAVLASLIALSSCQCAPEPFTMCEGVPAPPDLSASELTYHQDVKPIVEARCARCHVDGGLAPFPLTTVDDLRNNSVAVRASVATRHMPPWMPAPCCNSFRDDASLSPEQISTITTWIDEGMNEGDPANTGAPLTPIGVLPRIDTTLVMPDVYTPDVASKDDTRCFMLDWPFDEKKFVTGFGVTPGERPMVHHALVVIAPGSARASFESLDDQDEALGWSCPGGVILGIDGYLGGWSPGWEGQTTPEGTGHAVDPDDVVILTVHYTRPHDGSDALPDQTSVDLMIEDRVDDELVSIVVSDQRWWYGGMPIKANVEDTMYAVEYDPTDVYSLGQPMTLVAVNLHMHERGKSGVVGIRRAARNGNEARDECLVQVDDYRHEWQGDYVFQEPTVIEDGDLAYVECHFDNTAGHQRIVDGAPEEPRDLNWAEDQEMCVGFITAIKPK